MTNINIDRRLAVIVAVGLNLIIYLFYQVVRSKDILSGKIKANSQFNHNMFH